MGSNATGEALPAVQAEPEIRHEMQQVTRNRSRSYRWGVFALCIFAGLSFFPGLSSHDLWPPDEPRFAQVAQEMVQSGDYLVPRINGAPYQEKPPLMFWITALFSLPGGQVTELTARLPSALSASAAMFFTFLLGRSLFGTVEGALAALLLATMQRFWLQAHAGQLDMLLCACTTASLYFLWRWQERRQGRMLFGLYGAIAAGALTKGPPALLFPLFTAIVFYWKERSAWKALHPLIGLGAGVLAVSCWLLPSRIAAHVEAGAGPGASLGANLFRQTIGRFFLGVSHAREPWYYFTHTPLDLLPWSLFLPWVIWVTWPQRKQITAVRFVYSWLLPPIIFFSLSLGKREVYLLPIYPAIALLTAHALPALLSNARPLRARVLHAAFALVFLAAGIAPWLPQAGPYLTLQAQLLLSGVGAAGMALLLLNSLRGEARMLPLIVAGTLLGVALALQMLVLPKLDQYKSARSFCAPLRTLSEKKVSYDLYSVAMSREEYIFYSRHPVEAVPAALFDIPESPEALEEMKNNLRLMRSIQKQLNTVPLASPGNISAVEAAELRTSLEKLVEKTPEVAKVASKLEATLHSSLDHLIALLDEPAPAFVLVQEQDWRWVVALKEEARTLNLLHEEQVGDLHMLLFANAAGRQLAEEHTSSEAETSSQVL